MNLYNNNQFKNLLQVYNLFNKTAKGIFDGAESATPGCPEIF